MGAYNGLKSFFEKSLEECAMELGYDVSNIYILRGDENALKINCPEIYKNLLSCDHNRDKRTPMEYAQDLVASWIFEDKLVEAFLEQGLTIRKAGADRTRLLLPKEHVSAGSDTKLYIDEKERYMEIMCDYTGYWSRHKKVDLRDDKYPRLCREKSLFLGIDVVNKAYLLLDFAKNIPATYHAQHGAYGGKQVYTIYLNGHQLATGEYKDVCRRIVYLLRNS